MVLKMLISFSCFASYCNKNTLSERTTTLIKIKLYIKTFLYHCVFERGRGCFGVE